MQTTLEMTATGSRATPLQFYKYSVCGNNFVLVDESQGAQLSESEKSVFARLAANEHFGIGCDSILYLQAFSADLLRSICPVQPFWGSHQNSSGPPVDLIFRVFEPNGKESMCCGNGLLSVAHLLNRRYGMKSARILTEIPSSNPRAREVRTLPTNGTCCVNMGPPLTLPREFIQKDVIQCVMGSLSVIDDLQVAFQVKAMDGLLQNFQLPLQGFLTYTGEPHLVILDNHKHLLNTVKDPIALGNHHHPRRTDIISVAPTDANVQQKVLQLDMSSVVKAILDDQKECARETPNSIYSVRLLRQIGLCLNTDSSPLFPEGMNINFVRILDAQKGIIEYRCFERGNRKETLACGTGAIAIAAAASQFNLVRTDTLRLWPKSSRYLDPNAELRTLRDADGNWWLEGDPRLLFCGSADFFLGQQAKPAAIDTSTHESYSAAGR